MLFRSFRDLKGKRWSGYLSWRKNRSRRYLPSVLELLCEAIKQEEADTILVTGDLIQIGLDDEVSQARDWLRQLGDPGRVMLVPGNHDIYANGSEDAVNTAWGDYMYGDGKPGSTGSSDGFPVLRQRGNLSLIGVTSACVTPVFMATGRVGDEQLDRLSHMLELAAGEGRTVCLLIHHPPLKDMTSWRKGLMDASGLERVLEAHPPAMILHGHLHHNREWHWRNSRIFCTAAASSASDASYRVFDIEGVDGCRRIQMTLKSICMELEEQPRFVEVDQDCWEVPAS